MKFTQKDRCSACLCPAFECIHKMSGWADCDNRNCMNCDHGLSCLSCEDSDLCMYAPDNVKLQLGRVEF